MFNCKEISDIYFNKRFNKIFYILLIEIEYRFFLIEKSNLANLIKLTID